MPGLTLAEAPNHRKTPANGPSFIDAGGAEDVVSLLDEIGEAIVEVDADWIARFCNDTYLQNIGLRRDEVIGRTPFDFFPGFRHSIFYQAIEGCRVSRKPMSRIGFSAVLERWLMVRVFPVGNGGMVMLANDASESVVKQHQLAQSATIDQLTSLGNKLAMELFVNKLLDAKAAFSIVVVGLNRFKDVNETHGYATGDMVLLKLASSLKLQTEEGAELFRLSGDEFAVVSSNSGQAFEQHAASLLAAVAKPVSFEWFQVSLTASAGAVRSPGDGRDFETLLKHAGLALKEAKKGAGQGGAPVVAYRSEFEVARQMRAALEEELRLALDGDQFRLMVQPKVSLRSGKVIGGEALVRWAHPKSGLLAPGVFLPVAKEIGAMVALDEWVLRRAIRYLAELQDKGSPLPISVNLSVDSLADRSLVERVTSCLATEGVDARLLEIEIPEGALMQDVDVSARVLDELTALGIKISIDDFGTGYSSFAYLAQFPVRALKIDRSFIVDLCLNDKNQRIVQALVGLAHRLQLEVIAEGAETDEQVVLLRRMMCDTVQGYVFSKPLSWTEFQTYVDDQAATAVRRPDPFSI